MAWIILSPERTTDSGGKCFALARASCSSVAGITSLAPFASAVTMVVVANNISSTTTTLAVSRAGSKSSLRNKTWTLLLTPPRDSGGSRELGGMAHARAASRRLNMLMPSMDITISLCWLQASQRDLTMPISDLLDGSAGFQNNALEFLTCRPAARVCTSGCYRHPVSRCWRTRSNTQSHIKRIAIAQVCQPLAIMPPK